MKRDKERAENISTTLGSRLSPEHELDNRDKEDPSNGIDRDSSSLLAYISNVQLKAYPLTRYGMCESESSTRLIFISKCDTVDH